MDVVKREQLNCPCHQRFGRATSRQQRRELPQSGHENLFLFVHLWFGQWTNRSGVRGLVLERLRTRVRLNICGANMRVGPSQCSQNVLSYIGLFRHRLVNETEPCTPIRPRSTSPRPPAARAMTAGRRSDSAVLSPRWSSGRRYPTRPRASARARARPTSCARRRERRASPMPGIARSTPPMPGASPLPTFRIFWKARWCLISTAVCSGPNIATMT